jgi:hypothetical protein
MTEPKEPASDETERMATPGNGGEPAEGLSDTAPGGDEAARAEAEAAAMAADELGGEDEPDGEPDDELDDDEDGDGDDDESDDAGDDSVVADAGAAGAAAELASGSPAERRRAARSGKAARPVTPQTIIDPSIRVSDQASKIFVIGTVLVFFLIFAYGALLGQGGTITGFQSPSPIPIPSAAVVPSVAPSPSVGASGSPTASGSPAASPAPSSAPAASGSPAPS